MAFRTAAGLVAVLLGLLAAMPVSSQSREQACSARLEVFPLPPFEEFDVNGDEAIRADEARRCRSLQIVFTELDLDNDEALNRAEYRAFAAIWTERARSFGLGR